MFNKYFSVTESGEVKIKDSVTLNLAQQVIAKKLLENIQQGVGLMETLSKLPNEVIQALAIAGAAAKALSEMGITEESE